MPTVDSPCIGIVLLNYRGTDDTLACLDSLLRSDSAFTRLAICDNASPDGSLDKLRAGLLERGQTIADFVTRHRLACKVSWAESSRQALVEPGDEADAAVLLIDNQENRGFAAGNNVGLRWLLQDPAITHFWLLNNDTEVPSETLGALRDAVSARPEIDLWGGTLLYHSEPDRVQAFCGGALNRRSGETRHVGAFKHRSEVPDSPSAIAAIEAEVDYALGACMVATRRWIERAGLLCESYFLYYEELDWATRGRSAGMQLGYAPKVVVLHKEGASIGTAPHGGSALSVKNLTRSRVLYARLHLGRWVWPTLLAGLLKQTAKHVVRGRFGNARASVLGLLDGLQSDAGP